MQIPFTKMHGFGNDFIVIRADGIEPPTADTIRRLADRRTGIGFDQLLWLEPPHAGGDVFYRIFNADGSEAEQCGNGARCIARFIGAADDDDLALEYPGGIVHARLEGDDQVSVELGEPDLRPEALPFIAEPGDPPYAIDAVDGPVEIRVVSVGNPHAVILVDDVDTAPVAVLGAALESHSRFPNRANIGFMQVVAANRIRLRVFERGAGETPACGTGACAAVVVGRDAGLLDPRVDVELRGGRATVRWDGPGSPVWLTGDAVTVFEGSVDL